MATINGTSANERLIGTDDADTISGGAGMDVVFGRGGNDTIDSVDRPDNIFAGVVPPEADMVFAGDGDDFVTGGRLDTLNGGAGNDFLLLNFNFDGPNLNPAAVTLTLNGNGVGTANDGTSIRGFETVNFTLTNQDDSVSTGNVQAFLDGMGGNDTLTTGLGNDQVFGGGGNDTISTGSGNDTISGGSGNDMISGGDGDDSVSVDPASDGADQVNLGSGNDTVSFVGFDTGQIRVTFTSADVGNGSALDGANAANEDGGLAVRIQREDANGNLIGDVSRYDDEGITFVEGTQGFTFDVRDLVSGTQRGDQFTGVVLGTSGDDTLSFFPPFRSAQPFYYNAGMGNDTVIAGSANDFLVGGLGNDTLTGNGGNDNLLGGAGNDTANFNVSTDGADNVDLGADADVVNVSAAAGGQVRLTFTSAEVGNGSVTDSSTMANQDGGLAVRLQAEDGSGALTGNVSRFDDEGITFVSATPGLTFDVRDLVSGVARGDQFEVVTLGTLAGDALTAVNPDRSYYINGGMGDDQIVGGNAADFLVGGAGNDRLTGGGGLDSFIGGGGNDTFVVNDSAETINEAAGGGIDTVISSVGFTLAAEIENLRLAPGAGGISGTGNGLANVITGNSGANIISGLDGNDRLVGLQGDDQLFGGIGADRLLGGVGDDQLTGGDGADLFFFAATDGSNSDDVVLDFQDGTDLLVLRDLTIASIVDGADGAVITFGNGATATLLGVDDASLGAGDFRMQGISSGDPFFG